MKQQNNTMLRSVLSYSDKNKAIADLAQHVGSHFDGEHPTIFTLPSEIAELEKRLKASQKEIERLEKDLAKEPPLIPVKSSEGEQS